MAIHLAFARVQRGQGHKLLTLLLGVFFFIDLAFADDEELRLQQWREDLQYYELNLRSQHINLFHTVSEQTFTQCLQQIYSNLPHLSDWQVIIELMRLTRRVDDGHTTIPLWGARPDMFPLKFEYHEDSFLVTAASEQYSFLLGSQLQSVNNMRIEHLSEELAGIVPFVENEYSQTVRIGQALSNAALLKGLGVVSHNENYAFVFLTPDSKNVTHSISVIDNDSWSDIDWHRLVALFPHEYFLYQEQLSIPNIIDVGFTSDQKTVYLGISTYPTFEEMLLFGEELFVNLQKAKASNIVIDLRNSFGGDLYNGLMLASFLNQLDAVDWESGVFVLTSPKTFSAAMVNAKQFWRLLNAHIYGMPTGAIPNGYQDMGSFVLPHSGLMITYSKRRFRIEDEQNTAVLPDVLISPTISDLITGYDRVLSKVMKRIQANDRSDK